jgi:pyridoxine 5-phosphate synthase
MPAQPPIRLGVNIDHVATVRNARGGKHPDPIKAAEIAIAAGADGITAHLREDRRHIVDDDIARLKARLGKPLNLEMAATQEMVEIARKLRPHAACLVPERRQERTTEGGLDAVGQREALRAAVGRLADAGIRVSLFIAAEPMQIEAAVAIGSPVIELHTGAWCDSLATGDAAAAAEFNRIARGAALAANAGLEVHAGHGLDYSSAENIAVLPEIVELNIGHFLVGEAIFDGFAAAVRKMRAAMDRGRARIGSGGAGAAG